NCSFPVYNPVLSKPLSPPIGPAVFLNGNISGRGVSDTFTLGATVSVTAPLTLANQSTDVALNSGVLALATGPVSFLTTLKALGKIPAQRFGFYVDDKLVQATIDIGFFNTSVYSSVTATLPMASVSNASATVKIPKDIILPKGVTILGFSLNNSFTPAATPITGFISSGISLSFLPKSTMKLIASATGAVMASNKLYEVDCSKSSTMPVVSVSFAGGFNATWKPIEYLYKYTDPAKPNLCFLAMTDYESPLFQDTALLGLSMLNKFYLAFDMDANTIALGHLPERGVASTITASASAYPSATQKSTAAAHGADGLAALLLAASLFAKPTWFWFGKRASKPTVPSLTKEGPDGVGSTSSWTGTGAGATASSTVICLRGNRITGFPKTLMEGGFWDKRFDPAVAGHAWAYGTDPNDFVVSQQVLLQPGSRVLSLGEGEGRNAIYLAKQGHSVHCLDLSPVGRAKCLDWAKREGVQERITYEVADLTALPALAQDDSIDAVVSIWCHVPSALAPGLHDKVFRCLKDGGVYLLEAYCPSNIGRGTGGPQQADLCPTAASLEELCAARSPALSRWSVSQVERNIHEGPFHNGLSSTVQMVVWK
ncbi:hypothetical protein HDU91_006516, partial [Kappamyces sp. JEL0680]